jgi:hypothetical protein
LSVVKSGFKKEIGSTDYLPLDSMPIVIVFGRFG